MKLPDVEATDAQITDKIGALRHALDPERRAAELAEITAPFRPGGAWQYAPKAERVRAEKEYTADQDRAAAFALYYLERAVLDTEPALGPIKAEVMAPPSAEAAWLERTAQPGVRAELGIQIAMLDELRRARVSGALGSMTPSATLKQYQAALSDPTEQANATLIRIVEATHGEGWEGVAPHDDDGIAAAVELRRAIATARETRIPESVRRLEATIASAKHTAARAKALNGIAPLNPLHVAGAV